MPAYILGGKTGFRSFVGPSTIWGTYKKRRLNYKYKIRYMSLVEPLENETLKLKLHWLHGKSTSVLK